MTYLPQKDVFPRPIAFAPLGGRQEDLPFLISLIGVGWCGGVVRSLHTK